MISRAIWPKALKLVVLALLLGTTFLFLVGCVRAPTRGWSGPLVSDNVLYVGTLEGQVIALNLLDVSGGTPTLEWNKDVVEPSGGGGFACAGQISRPMGVYGTPIVKDDRVYFAGYDGSVFYVALDGNTISDPGFKTDGAIVGSPIIYGDTLFVGSSDGYLYAISLDLRQVWEFPTDDKIWGTPAAFNGVVYVGSADQRMYAVDAATGREIWHFQADGAIMSTPLVHEGRIYIGACDRNFYAVDLATEEERAAALARDEGAEAPEKSYSLMFEGAGNWFWTTAMVYQGEVWVGCLDHKMYALGVEDLALHWEYETGGMIHSPPVISGGMVIFGSQDGKLYGVDPATKNPETLYSPDEEDQAPILAPIFADATASVVYFHAQNGEHVLYAFDVETKDILWSFRTDQIED